jgi:hypothetical protein
MLEVPRRLAPFLRRVKRFPAAVDSLEISDIAGEMVHRRIWADSPAPLIKFAESGVFECGPIVDLGQFLAFESPRLRFRRGASIASGSGVSRGGERVLNLAFRVECSSCAVGVPANPDRNKSQREDQQSNQGQEQMRPEGEHDGSSFNKLGGGR